MKGAPACWSDVRDVANAKGLKWQLTENTAAAFIIFYRLIMSLLETGKKFLIGQFYNQDFRSKISK